MQIAALARRPNPSAATLFGAGLFRLVLRQQPVDLGDAQPFGRVPRQPLQAAGRPQLAAFGFKVLAVEIGHAPLWAQCSALASVYGRRLPLVPSRRNECSLHTKKATLAGRLLRSRCAPAYEGISTVSMTWMTPFEAATSVAVTVAVLPAASRSTTLSPSIMAVRVAPLTVVSV